jgi:thermitase
MKRALRAGPLACVLALSLAGSAWASSQPYDAHTVIVQFRPGVSQLQQSTVLQAAGAGRVVSGIYGLQAKVASTNVDPAVVARLLNLSSLVQYAEPNFILRATATPNDPRFGEMYGMTKIQAPAGWDAAGLGAFPSSGGVKVGIVDTGIQANHEDLVGKVAACGRYRVTGILFGTSKFFADCADDNGHGTHTSGTITANTNNGKGVAGVAFNSQLIVCKALYGTLGSGSTVDVANCMNWAHDQGAKVISMSLGGGDSTTLHNAAIRDWAGGGTGGSVLVAAAGNDGNSNVNYPAGYAEVVSVAASDSNDAHASFSNTNADVEVDGPGVNVLSTYTGNSYTTLSGTSMATPHAAGVAAIIWDKYPTAAASTIRSKLDAATDDLGAPGRDTTFGFGRVNLLKAANG